MDFFFHLTFKTKTGDICEHLPSAYPTVPVFDLRSKIYIFSKSFFRMFQIRLV